MVGPAEMFTFFFVMLDPLKVVGPFAQRTRGIDERDDETDRVVDACRGEHRPEDLQHHDRESDQDAFGEPHRQQIQDHHDHDQYQDRSRAARTA